MPKVVQQSMKVKTKPAKHGKSESVLDRIQPVSLSSKGLTMNLYGRSGTGKTVLACTFPKPLLIIGLEDGTKSVHNVKGVEFVAVNSSEEVGELMEHLASSNHFKTVVLDTASMLQDLVLKEILGLEELPAQKSWGMATREQYGQCSLQTKERLRALLDLSTKANKMNVVIVAQEREFNTEDNSSLLMPFVASALTPSVVGWLNPACDYIGQTFIRQKEVIKKVKIAGKVKERRTTDGVEYGLRTAPDPTFTTKFRLPKGTPVPDVIVDPDYDKIYALIRGGN
ncbi:ATP-binding protein [Candidatus Pacearchaeota archaeon]|jgi:hypothetical protein|nr:ATP-binding protein [Candidatus Pacearchaeota archaeon]